ncbi:unnamed protein product [Ostreobium quekettii]|uniref:Uncharacterized protein n=1 Tax=Ostreobium quekettii TaxID=121088 RepID=A0A8S1IPX7_9CHLO|nr:unnamed protein product [Ostreobium quekettii]
MDFLFKREWLPDACVHRDMAPRQPQFIVQCITLCLVHGVTASELTRRIIVHKENGTGYQVYQHSVHLSSVVTLFKLTGMSVAVPLFQLHGLQSMTAHVQKHIAK